MNVKSITTLGLVAAALAVTSVAPAFANNNQALNQLAMQMYMQNQANATAYNPAYGYNAYNNPYANAGAYVNAYGQTPWSAGAITGGVYPSYNNYNRGYYNNRYNNRFNNVRRWFR